MQRRFPDFSYITQNGRLTDFLDCVIIRFVVLFVMFFILHLFFNNLNHVWNIVHLSTFFSHFHLDHCGALPYMSEMVGYDGPIYMTHPTKAICPILLEDFRKITVDKKGETNFFTSQMIKDCMKKVIPLNLHQTVQVQCWHHFWPHTHTCLIVASAPAVSSLLMAIQAVLCWWQVDDELEIKAYYAGHVLGAAMVQIKVGSESVVYTVSVNKCVLCHSRWIYQLQSENNFFLF